MSLKSHSCEQQELTQGLAELSIYELGINLNDFPYAVPLSRVLAKTRGNPTSKLTYYYIIY